MKESIPNETGAIEALEAEIDDKISLITRAGERFDGFVFKNEDEKITLVPGKGSSPLDANVIDYADILTLERYK